MGPRLPGVRAAWERSIGPAAVREAVDGVGRGAGVWVGAFWGAGRLWERRSLALLSNLMQSWTNSSKVSGGDTWYERAVFNP